MKLTKLSAAPGWSPTTVRMEVPPRARAGRMDAGTASQLIRGVRQTQGGVAGVRRRMGTVGRIVAMAVVSLALAHAAGADAVQIYADGKLRGAFEPRGEP